MKIKVTKVEKSRIGEVDFDNLGFGKKFTDHMVVMDYKNGKWGNPEIIPYGDFLIKPGCCTLHYGQVIFEGMKAFWAKDNINLFRPYDNLNRLNNSARRIVIPKVDVDIVYEALVELLKLDKDWMPKKDGCSMYIRPFIMATDEFVGLGPSSTYRLFIILSPVDRYYPNPVKLWASTEFVRAVKGGVGEAKVAGNYAASLLATEIAKTKGCNQVLWLDAKHLKYVEEVGSMNVFFLMKDRDGQEVLITPALSGSILSGITRKSVIQLAEEFGIKVEERPISIKNIIKTSKEGRLPEAFGSGTAASISPIGGILYENGEEKENIIINNGQIGPIAQRFLDTLTGIQYGKIPDKFGWIKKIE